MSADPTAAETAVMPGDDVSAGEIVRRTEQHVSVMPVMSPGEIESYWRIASALARSRMFKDAYQAEQAFAKILIGRDLGISPTQSLMGIDLVEGGIQFRGVLLGQFLRKHADYDYRVLEVTDERAVVQLLGFPSPEPWDESMVHFRGKFWEVLGEEKFDQADVDRANLTKGSNKAAHSTYPRNMRLWRALSNAVKFYAPDVFAGMPVYVEGEIPQRINATDGNGSGHAAGIVLPPEVEAVIKRADELGHQGYADRGTAEMAIGGQHEAHVREWVTRANAELDRVAAAKADEPTDADVVEDEPTSGSAEVPKESESDTTEASEPVDEEHLAALRRRAGNLEDRINEPGLSDDEAEQLVEELAAVEGEINAAANVGQGQLL